MPPLVRDFQFSTLLELLSYRAQSDPQMKAYTYLADGEIEQGHLTYDELDRRARAIGACLQEEGTVGERVLLMYPTGLDFIAAFFGCLYAGMIAVPIYPPRVKENMSRIQGIVEDAQITKGLTNTPLISMLKSRVKKITELTRVLWTNTDEIDPKVSLHWGKPPVNSKDLALIQYTSGSTGNPKGVMVNHGNLLHNQHMIKRTVGYTKESISVGWLPQFHDLGLIGQVLQPLFLGFPHIFMSPVAFMQKPARWLQTISHYKATTSGGPNFAYDLCVRKISPEQKKNFDLTSWQVAFVGAEPIQAETIDRFAMSFGSCGFRREALYPCYGLAEATLFVSGGKISEPPIVQKVESAALSQNQIRSPSDNHSNICEIVGCGRAWLDQKILIVDPETLRECPKSTVGEIWVSGSSVAQGYWNQHEESNRVFRAYLSDTGGGPFLRTGDLGFMRDEELFVTGRLKDLIIIGGQNHYPQDIELTVQESHPALRAGCGGTFSVDQPGGEKLVIFQEVEPRFLRTIDLKDVVRTIQQTVSEQHGIPVHAIWLLKPATLPKTSSGKIRRHACRLQFLEGGMDVIGQWTEHSLGQNLWQELQDNTNSHGQLSSPIDVEKQTSKISFKRKEMAPTKAVIQDWLVNQLSMYLKVPANTIDIHVPTAEYGLDSSVAVSLTGQLALWLDLKLEPTLFWEFPSIEALTTHLSKEQQVTQISAQDMTDYGN
jgi:acyl-CoA synthetase (AMP-forming)/AMP-acid ligase II/acyl carrier protein